MRRIKSVGIAAILALVVGAAVSAPGAIAGGFVAETGNAELSGISSGFEVSMPGVGTYECEGLDFNGALPGPSAKWETEEVSDGTCYAFGFRAPFEMKGCNFVFDPGSEPTFRGAGAISPDACGPIEFQAAFGTEATIYPGSGLESLHYENVTGQGVPAIKVVVEVENLKYSTGADGTVRENGKLVGQWLIAADKGGTSVGVSVADLSGVYMQAGVFAGEVFPTAVAGSSPTVHEIAFPGIGVFGCAPTFEGGLSFADGDLPLEASYQSCVQFGFEATVDMNSCSYVLHAYPAVGGPYEGAMELVCDQPGDMMEISNEICEGEYATRIPPQTVADVDYINKGLGEDRTILVEIDEGSSNMEWSACGYTEKEGAAYSGEVELKGNN